MERSNSTNWVIFLTPLSHVKSSRNYAPECANCLLRLDWMAALLKMRCEIFFYFEMEFNLSFQFGVMEGRPVNRTSDRPLMSLFFTFKKVIVCVIWEAIVCHKMYWKLGCNWRAPVLVAPSAKKTPPPLSGCVLQLTFYFYTMHILTQAAQEKKIPYGIWESLGKSL